MRRRIWLAHPTEPVAPAFEVRNNPTRIQAYGLAGNDVVPVEVLVGPSPAGTAGEDYQWVPLVRCGSPVELTSDHIMYLELVAGYYRLDLRFLSDPSNVYIEAVEDESSTDSRAMLLIESGQLCCQRTDSPTHGPGGP